MYAALQCKVTSVQERNYWQELQHTQWYCGLGLKNVAKFKHVYTVATSTQNAIIKKSRADEITI
jgi:hypothetical protein